MITDPSALAATVSAALLTGLAVGAILTGLAQRGQRAADLDRAEHALRDLLALAEACADPVHVPRLMRGGAEIWDNLRPDGYALALDAAPQQRTPAYVHKLIDAYASGDPLDFAGCPVPADVQGRLRTVTALRTISSDTSKPGARTPLHPAGGPITASTPPLAGGSRLVRPRSSDG